MFAPLRTPIIRFHLLDMQPFEFRSERGQVRSIPTHEYQRGETNQEASKDGEEDNELPIIRVELRQMDF